MTLWDYRYKNNVKKLYYAMRVYNNSCSAYVFSSKNERDWFVHRSNHNLDFSACIISRKEAFSITDYKKPETDVILVDNHNKLVCVSL